MTTLSLEHILEIHALAASAPGGSSGFRELGRFEAAIASQTPNVFGDDLYPTTIDTVAAIIRGIIADHPFVDGDKRTAMLAGLTFLELNGWRFTAQSGEIEDFAVPSIVKWLRNLTDSVQSWPLSSIRRMSLISCN